MFRVTGAILRAGRGQVECGQCHAVFNAVEHLIDEIPPGPAPEPAGALEPIDAADAGETSISGASVAASADPVQTWVNDLPTGEFLLEDGELVPVSPLPEPAITLPDTKSADELDDSIEVDEPLAPEEITLEGDRVEIVGTDDDTGDEPTLPPLTTGPASTPNTVRVDRLDRVVFDDDLADVETRSHGLAWGLGSLVLTLTLAMQVVHHYRQDLVRHPTLGPTLFEAYSLFGLPLAPNWDLTGYEVNQWGVATDPAHDRTLKLRASIMNRAGFAQPYPLLRLRLEDRWGNQIGAREFEPAEYLQPGMAPDRLLTPGERVDVEVAIVDPGEDAVGFQVDVCLRANSLQCASEQL